MTFQYKTRGARGVRPFDQEMERQHKVVEFKGIGFGPIFGDDILEVRQFLQIGAKTGSGEAFLEGQPTELLRLILFPVASSASR